MLLRRAEHCIGVISYLSSQAEVTMWYFLQSAPLLEDGLGRDTISTALY